MDEPFAALDAITRESMQNFLLDLWQRERMTVLFVTHDVEEAALLSDRVCVMSARPGRIVAVEEIGLEVRATRRCAIRLSSSPCVVACVRDWLPHDRTRTRSSRRIDGPGKAARARA